MLARERVMTGNKSRKNCVAFSPDGATVASSDYDGMIKLWDIATGKEQATLKGQMDTVWSVRFSPYGKILLRRGQVHPAPGPAGHEEMKSDQIRGH
jgi:WD40 repeat protein